MSKSHREAPAIAPGFSFQGTYSTCFRGLPPAWVLRRAWSCRKYSGPRLAIFFPPMLPAWALTIESGMGLPQ